MMLRQAIRLLIPALLAVGLALSPFTASAVERTTECETMGAMTGDMDHCPSEQPATPDCEEACPLVTTCAAQGLAGTTAIGFSLLALYPTEGAISSKNDNLGAPLAEGPPARPPRT
jgi:hypothetical protein